MREDYSLKAREDSVTVNFNSVTNPAMEVVTTAMKKEFEIAFMWLTGYSFVGIDSDRGSVWGCI